MSKNENKESTENTTLEEKDSSIQNRYDIYVQCMKDLNKEYKTFDEWLNS